MHNNPKMKIHEMIIPSQNAILHDGHKQTHPSPDKNPSHNLMDTVSYGHFSQT